MACCVTLKTSYAEAGRAADNNINPGSIERLDYIPSGQGLIDYSARGQRTRPRGYIAASEPYTA